MERHCTPEALFLHRLGYASRRHRVELTGESLKFLGSRIGIYKIYSIQNSAETPRFRRGKRPRPLDKHHYAVVSQTCMDGDCECPHPSALEEDPQK